ncbi:hypothetical protein FRC10_012008 [Ceratobasidium sp. 414]|nr:hypothetical protein FRC10_012008 [Ceratobasidium sp. 414]
MLLLQRRTVTISSSTPPDEIIRHLTEHGCTNLTLDLDPPSSGDQPAAHGGFGLVYDEKLRDGRRVAIKALRVSFNADDEADKLPKVIRHTLSISANLILSQRAARELYTWSRCRHPNVLPLLGLAKVQDQIRMVSLWMENGSLPSYLDKHPELSRCNMNNVLVSGEGIPMITDFGNAVLQQGTLQFTETIKQSGFTPRWTAPELLDEREVKQGKEADVYALGMEIITGKVPYSYMNNSKTYFSLSGPHTDLDMLSGRLAATVVAIIKAIAIKKEVPKRPESIPPDSQYGDTLWSLLQNCWEFEPEQRPSAAEVANIMKGITREGLVPAPTEPEIQAETEPVPERPSKRRRFKTSHEAAD